MISDAKIEVSGWMNFFGGVDTQRPPVILQDNELSFAINVSLRGGYAETRPGFAERSMNFENEEMQDWVESHNVQGWGVYTPIGKTPFFMFSSGGRIFKLDILGDYRVSDVTPTKVGIVAVASIAPPIGSSITIVVDDADGIFVGYPIRIGTGWFLVTAKTANNLTCENISMTPGEAIDVNVALAFLDPNSSLLPRAYFLQAEENMVIQNGRSLPIIFNGSQSRRANHDEIPTGTVMAYSQGRIWVAVTKKTFVAGDIYGGVTGVLGMTENNLLNKGGAFTVPNGAGDIRAMIPMPTLDTSFGQGPLQIICENRIFSVNAPAARDEWQNMTDPIQTVSVVHSGGLDQYSCAVVNGDVYYRSQDGIRSLIMARREFGSWGQTPVSGQMDRVLRADAPQLLRYCTMTVFDNRLLTTCATMQDTAMAAYYGRGIVSLNFDPVNKMGEKGDPVWEGLWTGIQPYFVLSAKFDDDERCFAFVRNSDNETELWEITKDADWDGVDGRIISVIETAAAKGTSVLSMKALEQAEVWVDSVVGTVDFVLKYRPDQYPCWFDWPEDIQICAKRKDCTQELDGCLLSRTFQPGYRTRLRWGRPPELVENFDWKPAHVHYEAQLRLQWTGRARVKALILKARSVEEEPHAGDL